MNAWKCTRRFLVATLPVVVSKKRSISIDLPVPTEPWMKAPLAKVEGWGEEAEAEAEAKSNVERTD